MTLLLDVQNPHAPLRSNGRRGWYYPPPRRREVRLLVVHTSESVFDTVPPDSGAERVGDYLARRVERPASYHDIVDADSHVPLLPWDHTAFGAVDHNSNAVHLAFAGQAAMWSAMPPDYVEATLQRGAAVARRAIAHFGLPAVRLSSGDARGTVDQGRAGICGHVDVDPDRRTDPGHEFPWSRFLDLVKGSLVEDWLEKWPPPLRRHAQQLLERGVITKHTDPNQPVGDVPYGEYLIVRDRHLTDVARRLRDQP